jgi:hypothetical protein
MASIAEALKQRVLKYLPEEDTAETRAEQGWSQILDHAGKNLDRSGDYMKKVTAQGLDRLQMSDPEMQGPRLPYITDEENEFYQNAGMAGPTMGVLKVAKGVKGAKKAADAALDMSEKARMKRAKSMGFDTSKTYYHGTKSEIVGDGFDQSKIKQGGAFFFSEDPEFAGKFASGTWNDKLADYEDKGANVLPVHLKAQKTFDPDNSSHMAQIKEAVRPVYEKRWAHITDPDEKAKMIQVSMNSLDGSYPSLERSYVLDAIKNAGFDSYQVYENGRKNTAVFDPTQIRSKFAAFDPKKKKSGNLSAGIAGAIGAGGAYGLVNRDPEQEAYEQALRKRLGQ